MQDQAGLCLDGLVRLCLLVLDDPGDENFVCWDICQIIKGTDNSQRKISIPFILP